MVVIVTGAVGVGKTTVCRQIIRLLLNRGYTCGGIVTYKAANQGIIVEDIQSGNKRTLASINNVHDRPRTARYFFDPAGINFGIQAIDNGASAEILIVDEIGHLELRGEGFTNVIELIRSGRVKNCILVIRESLLATFLPKLNTEPFVFETTLDNRDRLSGDIDGFIAEKLMNTRKHISG